MEAETKHRLMVLEKELLLDHLGEKDKGSGGSISGISVSLGGWRDGAMG